MEGNRVRLERSGTVGLALSGDGGDRTLGVRVRAPWLGAGSWSIRVEEWSPPGKLREVAVLEEDRPRLGGVELGGETGALLLTVELGGSPWVQLEEMTIGEGGMGEDDAHLRRADPMEGDPREGGGAGEVGSRPDIVLVIQDAARPDRVGAYGHERPTTPHLDRLARGGLLFRRAYS
ncbi:MAG: sulfatase-like hydrolase/transferase, partial [Thermoanaerobaculia bacterium]|nr:sulfatase-like hydrolase/transferase [Thermoanaerobaculia bacterium]